MFSKTQETRKNQGKIKHQYPSIFSGHCGKHLPQWQCLSMITWKKRNMKAWKSTIYQMHLAPMAMFDGAWEHIVL